MTKYRIRPRWDITIEAVEIDGETEKFVIIKGRRVAKFSDYGEYHNSRMEAVNALIEYRQKRIEGNRSKVKYLHKEIDDWQKDIVQLRTLTPNQ